jgi:hypothetical protein
MALEPLDVNGDFIITITEGLKYVVNQRNYANAPGGNISAI